MHGGGLPLPLRCAIAGLLPWANAGLLTADVHGLPLPLPWANAGLLTAGVQGGVLLLPLRWAIAGLLPWANAGLLTAGVHGGAGGTRRPSVETGTGETGL